MAWRVATVLVLSTLAGCALERAPLQHSVDVGGRDAGALDAPPGLDAPDDVGPLPDVGPIDAPITPIDTGTDSGVPPIDAGMDAPITPIDAGTDAGPPDAGQPDSPSTTARDAGTDAGLRTCADLFGGIATVVICEETDTSCIFYIDPTGTMTSCATVCSGRSTMCNEGYDDGNPDDCAYDSSAAFGCAGGHNDMVCDCTRIP